MIGGARVVSLAAILAAAEPALPEPAPLVVRGPDDVELLQAARAVAEKVGSWRGVRFPSSLLAQRASAEQRRVAADEVLRSWIPPERLDARGRAWSDVGLGSAATPEEVYAALAGDLEGIAASRDGRRLLVDAERLSEKDFGPTEGNDPAMALLLATGVRPDEPVVAHLADHALDLQGGAGPPPPTTDALLASRAWAEGRSNVLACRLLFEGVGAAEIIHGPTFDPSGVLQGALVPKAFFSGSPVARSLVYFVYGEGFAQAAALAKERGIAAIGAAARERRSSRDVLHPDRSPAAHVEIAAAGLRPPPGFALADRDTLGEQGIVTLVSVATGKDNLGLLAGDGWLGDALFRYEAGAEAPSGADRGFSLWVSRWIDVAEAEDFLYCFGRALQARYPGASLESADEGRRLLRTADRVIRLHRDAETVTVRIAPSSLDGILERREPNPSKTPPRGGK